MNVATKDYVDAKEFTLEDGSVTTSKIANKSVSEDKLYMSQRKGSYSDFLTSR